jgi:hypothetical protein
MATNHVFTAKVWQSPAVRKVRHAVSPRRVYRYLNAHRRRLPDYIIAGAQKSGTTSLWYYLNEHPLVEKPMTKEMNYFDLRFTRPLKWYRMHFPLRQPNFDSELGQATLTGESSAYYMLHPLAPKRIAQTLPNVKIILLLRNPVDRAYSHYQLKLRRRQEELSFEDAIQAEEARLDGEEDRICRDPGYYSVNHDRFSYLARGRYLEQIVRWHAVLPSNQLLILESGEFFKKTAEVYQRVLDFLNLPSFEPPRFGNRFPGKYTDKMSAQTRSKLVEYFQPYNAQLFGYLGKRFAWDV